jgi:hypothetical protein
VRIYTSNLVMTFLREKPMGLNFRDFVKLPPLLSTNHYSVTNLEYSAAI